MHKQQKAECRLGLLCNPVSKRVTCRYRIMLRSTMKDDFRSNPCPCSAFNGKMILNPLMNERIALDFMLGVGFIMSGKRCSILPLKQTNMPVVCLI